MTPKELEGEVDRLYGLPLAEFTDARNALAAALRSRGDGDAAARVKALPKPSASAWAVNQLYFRERERFAAVVRAGDRLRAAQAGGAGAEEVREAMRERRAAVAEALHAAERALAAAGHGAAGAVRTRVHATLEALAAYGSARPRETDGRLADDLAAPGFDALAALSGPVAQPMRAEEERPRSEASPVVPPSGQEGAARAEASEAARAELRRAEAELGVCRRQAEAAATARAEAERRAEGARAEQEEAERRLERSRQRVAETTAARAEALAQAERAAAALEAAERAVAAARAALAKLER
jgi:hypothetical protein